MPVKETLQQKVWDYIRRNPNFRAGDILMLIPISKVGLTRYLVALTNAEYLQKQARETRPKHFEDNEYTLIKKVGVCAPKYNETALYDPNTKTTYPLGDGELKSVRDGAYVSYSLLLGKLPKFLSNYKGLNPHLTSAEECYNDYLAKKKDQDDTIKKVHKIYSFLRSKKELFAFGEHLCAKGFFTTKKSFTSTMRKTRKKRVRELPKCLIDNCETIVKEFEALYGAVKTLKETL